MKNLFLLITILFGIGHAMGQITNVIEKFPLPAALSESSGAIFFNNKLITHNDSGGENKLFELDTITGQVTRTVTISNVANGDWEDITQDDTSIYIGDIGNNNGNRTDLKIYKISKTDYANATDITAETIAYSYSDQTDFTSNPNNTIWDAEALISFDENNLILFTKNWVDGITKGYLIPKTAGTYSVNPVNSTLNSGGLITGGTYNPSSEKLYLVGYSSFLQPFVWVGEGFTGSDIFSGTNTKTVLSSFGLEQTEAIDYVNENRYFITSESFSVSAFSDYAKLIAFSTNDTTLSSLKNDNDNAITVFPNPTTGTIQITGEQIQSIEIYDTKLSLLYQGNGLKIDLSDFSIGLYIVKINLNDKTFQVKKVVKN